MKPLLSHTQNLFQNKQFRQVFEPLNSTVDDVFARKVVVERAIPDHVKLDSLVEQSRRVLFTTRTIFPFDFFPDIIQIDENKVDIIERIFFFSEQVFPIAITDIRNVTVTTDLLFASLTIEIRGYETNPGQIKFLQKYAAAKIRRLIFGLMQCKKQDIDLTSIPVKELVPKLEQIGAAVKG